MTQPRKIKFLISPADAITKKAVGREFSNYSKIKKDETGKEKRYLCGISSGLEVDGHGERMSKEAIDDMLNQFNSKDIPLYANHGRVFTEDIGLATLAEKLPNGDLYTEYELNDSPEAEKVWKQINALPPYKHHREFGFSIEGLVPEDKIERSVNGNVIHKVDLDPGVSLVSKPAYTASIVSAIQKALGTSPIVKSVFDDVIQKRKSIEDFHESLEEIDFAMETAEDSILTSSDDPETKELNLRNAYQSYIDKKIELLRQVNFSFSDTADMLSQSSQPPVIEVEQIDNKINEVKNIMGEDMKTILANVMSQLQQLLQIEQAEGEQPMAESKQEAPATPEEKAVTDMAKSIVRRQSYKSLMKLLKEAEEKLDETEKASKEDVPGEETEKAEDEAETVKDILAKAEDEGSGVMEDAEDALTEIQPSDEQVDELAKALAESGNTSMAKAILALKKKSKVAKSVPSKKDSPLVALAKQLAETKKELNRMKSNPVNKGLNHNLGASFTAKDIEGYLKAQKSNINSNVTLSEASGNIGLIFGGR